ncbi:MAG: zf-TFIIB domain-containing protein [Candidatus Sungbacteria bacterium]|nr:zf-TFIIB domain-containing protein [bacterium]MDZ4260562.1 zf-TFIIB domain-containing protein [Candidatus Sungbacteria bacterium]
MQCPNCKNELKKITYKDVELDQCLNCEGMWLDGDELRVVKDRKDELLRWLDLDLFADAQKFAGGYSSMRCPKDNDSLYEISYDNADIKVDVCKVCKGVWLDKEELDKIVAFLKRTIFQEDVGHYLTHLEEQIKEVFTGSESFISELRDAYIVFRLLEYRLVSQWPRIEEILIPLRTALLK